MFDNLSLSFYNEKENILKKLNPISSTFLLFLISICIFLNTDFEGQLLFFLLSIVLSLACGKRLGDFIKMIFHTKFLILSMVLLGFLSRVSFFAMFVYFLKLYSLLLFSKLYLQNTKRSDVEKAFCYFLSPLKWFKLNPIVIAKSLSLSICFVSYFYKEAIKIEKSLQNRGILLKKCSPLKKIKWLKTLLIPLLLKTEETASRLADTLIVKGFEENDMQEVKFGNFSIFDGISLMVFLYLFLYIVLKEWGLCGI